MSSVAQLQRRMDPLRKRGRSARSAMAPIGMMRSEYVRVKAKVRLALWVSDRSCAGLARRRRRAGRWVRHCRQDRHASRLRF